MDTETLIIGGALSGLAVARALQRQRRSFQLVEARPQLGGRILMLSVSQNGKTTTFDLGPAWFWPGQERIKRLLGELGIGAFEQYASDTLVYEDEQGQIRLGRGYASMQGSLRMHGGLSTSIVTVRWPSASQLYLTAAQFGGYLEGALEAAERCVIEILH